MFPRSLRFQPIGGPVVCMWACVSGLLGKLCLYTHRYTLNFDMNMECTDFTSGSALPWTWLLMGSLGTSEAKDPQNLKDHKSRRRGMKGTVI